jgi:hypothetical protein
MKNQEHKDKPIIISDGEDDVFYCSYCSRRLLTLPKGVYECPTCVIKFDPTNQRVPRGRMITTLEGDIPIAAEPHEPAVSTTPKPVNPFDRKPVPMKGGFEALSKKGTLKFTSYSTTEKE